MLADILYALLYHHFTKLGTEERTRVIPLTIRDVALHIYRTSAVLEDFPAKSLDA